MGLFNFSGFKSTIKDVKNRLDQLEEEISALEKQRAEMVSLPLPYEDFAEWALGRYDHLARDYARQIRSEMLASDSSLRSFYMAQRNGHETLEDFNAVFSGHFPVSIERPLNYGQTWPMTDTAFFYIFGDILKAGVRKIMDEVVKPEWPNKVGLPRNERIPQIEKLENDLSVLLAEREQIRSDLADAVSTAL